MATERGSLGLGQRLVLLGAWLVSCGFVYVLGVYVGKGMRGGGSISPRVALPVEATVPPAPAPEAQAPLTFYDVLGSREGGTPAAPAGPPVGARPPQPPAMNEQKLPPAVPPPAAAPVAPPSAPRAVAKSPSPSPPAAAQPPPIPVAVAPPPAASPPATGAVPAKPATAATPPPPPALPPQAASGRWTVYANPSRDQLAVEHERAALRAKGYPAEVVTLRRDGDTWYRIRIGRYATETQAEEASRRLRNDGVGHAFVQSE